MCDLPSTLTPLSGVPTPPEVAIQTPWGRLISCLSYLKPVDLMVSSLKLGRGEHCDIVIHRSKFPQNIVLNISKEHFILTKDDEGIVYLTDLSKNGTFINKKLIGRNKTNILQSNDIISVGHRGLKVYIFKIMDSQFERYLPPELKAKYQLGELLGRGAVGEVRLLYEKTTCKKYAVKKIIKGRFTSSNLHHLNHPNKIYSEINILQSLDNPFIISMKEIVETNEEVFIILEYMEGGELTGKILSMTEPQAKFLFYQMVLAVQYLHSRGVTHRDLKPENVLLVSDRVDSLIKLSDFGLSKETENNIMQTMCGTPHYVAPEVLDSDYREYNNQVDIWSLGVILYYMLVKELPFLAPDRAALGRLIVKGKYTLKTPEWEGISYQAKDLIRKMLHVNPQVRITIGEILKHPWIDKDTSMQYNVHKLLKTACYTENNNSSSTSCSDLEPQPKKQKMDFESSDETTKMIEIIGDASESFSSLSLRN